MATPADCAVPAPFAELVLASGEGSGPELERETTGLSVGAPDPGTVGSTVTGSTIDATPRCTSVVVVINDDAPEGGGEGWSAAVATFGVTSPSTAAVGGAVRTTAGSGAGPATDSSTPRSGWPAR